MFKLFKVEEANKLIPVVNEHLVEMQTAVSDTLRLRQEMSQLTASSVDMLNKAQEINFLVRSVQASKSELDKLGVFVQDVDAGIVDFPSQVDGEVVCLSWEKGQETITHYHRLNEGTRLPLTS